jgi:hypothetical protein
MRKEMNAPNINCSIKKGVLGHPWAHVFWVSPIFILGYIHLIIPP